MLPRVRALPSVMRCLLVCLLIACGSSSAPEKRESPQPPKPAPVVVIDAGTPTLSAATLAKWEHGCFMLRTAAGLVENDHARCTQGRRPYSTFKLANALIAVDASVLDGPDAAMTWDKKAVPDEKKYLDAWRKEHTLRSAIKVSSVPHFRTLARTIGEARMKAGLAKLDYGNQNIGGGLDKFWLSGDIRISAEQQLAFVDKLAHGKLAASAKAQEVVREISTLETKGTRMLHGKTGSGPGSDRQNLKTDPGSDFLVWQVGWIENGAEIVPYAAWLEVTGGTFDEARAKRDELLRATLAELGVF
jgi:beta-lactamase class D